MPVMGFTKFERFFRAAGGVSVDRDDVKRYLDFVNDAIYDLLIIGQATAEAERPRRHRAVGPAGHQGPAGEHACVPAARGGDRAAADSGVAGGQPAARIALDVDTEARLPLLFGGVSVALARTFKLIDAEHEGGAHRGMGRSFSLFRQLI